VLLNFSSGQDTATCQIWNLSIAPSEIRGYSEYQNRRELPELSDRWLNSGFQGGMKKIGLLEVNRFFWIRISD
jgi:hypothetical protein